MTNEELVVILKEEITKAQSLRKWSKAHNLKASAVSKSVYAENVYPVVAAALGYRRTEEVWEEVKE